MKAYQAFSRDPSTARLRRLQVHLGLMAASTDEPVRIFLEQMAIGASVFTSHYDLETFRGSNELQMTSMLAIIAHWRGLYPDDFAVVHDASSNFFRRRELWEKITNSNVPAQTHPIGDGTFVDFPLRVVSTTSVNSQDNYSIQLCDVVAGLAARHLNKSVSKGDRILLNAVLAGGLDNINSNGIRPGHTFPDQILPARLTGPDVVDRMSQIIFGSHNNSR